MKKATFFLVVFLSFFPFVTFPAQVTTVGLYGFINAQSASRVIKALHAARDGDVVIIDINSPGGRVDVGDRIMTAMRTSHAHVVTQVRRHAYSEATIIALSNPDVRISKSAIIHFHLGGYVKDGGPEVECNGKALQVDRECQILRENTYRDYEIHGILKYLTPAEVRFVMSGGELFKRGRTIMRHRG